MKPLTTDDPKMYAEVHQENRLIVWQLAALVPILALFFWVMKSPDGKIGPRILLLMSTLMFALTIKLARDRKASAK
ncbi:hypothetical protein SAMN05421771_0356 [Granulicella pectinivorans]|uniref:Uncharacterized protein n=1 Tax=Granulicella pectinivorans TaxID=474950 RepID=A0A1I6L6W3_9BACT|nr:hypothetical protein [Granulicella pectinivorans]SFR99241.1 hypothetical protein SAMN05421771_0356 [Granulicella pectinivorans]